MTSPDAWLYLKDKVHGIVYRYTYCYELSPKDSFKLEPRASLRLNVFFLRFYLYISPDEPTSNPGTYMVEEEDQLSKVVL